MLCTIFDAKRIEHTTVAHAHAEQGYILSGGGLGCGEEG